VVVDFNSKESSLKYLLGLVFVFITFANANSDMPKLNLSYYIDKSNSLDISDISTKQFTFLQNSSVSNGYIDDTIWFKIDIFNPQIESNFILHFKESTWTQFDLYSNNQTTWQVSKNGLDVPLQQRSIKSVTPAFEILLPSNKTSTFYVKAQTISSQIGTFEIISHEEFFDPYILTIDKIYIILLFVFTTIALLNIYSYYLIKDKTYLYYVAYILMLIVFLSMHSGIYLILGLGGWTEGLHTTGALTLLLLLLFTDKFLNLKKNMIKAHKAFSFSSYIFGALTIALAFNVSHASLALNLFATLFFIVLFTVAIKLFLKGSIIAKFYLIALIFYLPLMGLMSLTFNATLDFDLLNRHLFILGAFIEILLFTLVLSSKYKYVADEKISLQNQLIEQKENTEKLLKEEIDKQTKNIQEILNKFTFASDNALSGYWEIDLHTNKVIFSDGWFNYLGYKPSDFTDIDTPDIMNKIIHEDDLELVHHNVKEFLEGKTDKYNVSFRIRHKDNSYTWINAIGAIYQNKFFGFLIDIDEIKNSNLQMMQQAKMASLGEMMGNIAHQWRQPLSVIGGVAVNIQMAKEFDNLTDDLIDSGLESINKNIKYLSKTIDTFRDFVKEKPELKKIMLQMKIDNILSIVSSTMQSNQIIINKLYHKTIELVTISSELDQVILNILNNAKDALILNNVNNPWITIELLKNNDTVTINIEDNGGGINPEIIDKIFEPYFTTKHKSQGTGLGLHMSYKIVEEHLKGKLTVSNAQQGAKFTIELPLDIS
jgi:PAS domain S-box-containing protein